MLKRVCAAALFFSFFSLASYSQIAAKPPVEDFLKRDVFGEMKLSPTGEYLAATVPLEDRTDLVILRVADMQKTGYARVEKKHLVTRFDWVNPTRIIFSMAEYQGVDVSPNGLPGLYGVNADGTGQGPPIIGYGADKFDPSGTLIKKKSNDGVVARMLDSLKDEDKMILVSIGKVSEGNDASQYGKFLPYSEVQKVNVQTGGGITVAKVPFSSADFTTDHVGEVRFASGSNDDNFTKTFYRKDRKSDWVLINDEKDTGIIVSPIGFDKNNAIAYLQYQEKTGPDSVYAYDTNTAAKTLLVRDDNVNPNGYLFSPVDNSLFGIFYYDGYPRIHYIDPKTPAAQALKSVAATFKENTVIPVSYSNDGNLSLYFISGDNMPGEYYLYDQTAKKLKFIAGKNSWLKPEMLARTDVYAVVARDGTKLEAFVTSPVGSSGKNLPLVVYPHGGPFGIFETWDYSSEVQMLASRGYAVLQVNFRGSGNYGRSFKLAGYKQWGGLMQDDLTDATRWAIKEGIAAPDRICIYGSSYGGYAALMGAVKEPDLYRCAIGDVGVYDMPMMFGRGDMQWSDSGENYLKDMLGEKDLISNSPSRNANKIKAAVLLLAGAEDDRAPKEHTEAMFNALKAAGKRVEMKVYDREGHGNFLIENKIDHANRVIEFLGKHIGQQGL
jgi:dipeptidyl aminopeptidase/acylaminoacyl peptidase